MSIFGREVRSTICCRETQGPSYFPIRKSNCCAVKMVDSVGMNHDGRLRSSFLNCEITRKGLLVTKQQVAAVSPPKINDGKSKIIDTRQCKFRRPRSEPREHKPRAYMLADKHTAALGNDSPGPSVLYIGPRAMQKRRVSSAIFNGTRTQYSAASTNGIVSAGYQERRETRNRDTRGEVTNFDEMESNLAKDEGDLIVPPYLGMSESPAEGASLVSRVGGHSFPKSRRFLYPSDPASESPGPIYRPSFPSSKKGVSWSQTVQLGDHKHRQIREARRKEVGPGPGDNYNQPTLIKYSHNTSATGKYSEKKLRRNLKKENCAELSSYEVEEETRSLTEKFAVSLPALSMTRKALQNMETHLRISESWAQRDAAIQIQSQIRCTLSRRVYMKAMQVKRESLTQCHIAAC